MALLVDIVVLEMLSNLVLSYFVVVVVVAVVVVGRIQELPGMSVGNKLHTLKAHCWMRCVCYRNCTSFHHLWMNNQLVD